MADWKNFWRTTCAPVLLERKKKLGRAMPEHEIASYVESSTGRPSGRGLVWSWLHGEREPFIGQFLALCEKLGVDPAKLLQTGAVARREPLFSSRAGPSVKIARRRSA